MTHIKYWIENADDNLNFPHQIFSSISAERLTLDCFIRITRRKHFRYFFKSLDQEFGWINEEVTCLDCIVPSADGQIEAWLHRRETARDTVPHNTEESITEEHTPEKYQYMLCSSLQECSLEEDSSNSEYKISPKQHHGRSRRNLGSISVSAVKRYLNFNRPARIMKKHAACIKQKNQHICEKHFHFSSRSKHLQSGKSRHLKTVGNKYGDYSRRGAEHFETVDTEYRFGYHHFSCPNCGVCCVLKNGTFDWIGLSKQTSQGKNSASGNVPSLRSLRSRNVSRSADEDQDDDNRLSSSEGYPRQHLRVSPGTESEKYAKAALNCDKFRGYLSDSNLPTVPIETQTLQLSNTPPQKRSPKDPDLCQKTTTLRGLDDECSRDWPLVSKVQSFSGKKPQEVCKRDVYLQTSTKMPWLLASSTESTSGSSLSLDKPQTNLLKKNSKSEHLKLGLKKGGFNHDILPKKAEFQCSRREESDHDMFNKMHSTPRRRQSGDVKLTTMTESPIMSLDPLHHFNGTKLSIKTESMGETLDLYKGRMCRSEPVASNNQMSLQKIFGDSCMKRSWSEPFDFSNGKQLSRGQGHSQCRSRIDSHITNTDQGSLELFNVSQWQVEQIAERGGVIYDEIHNNRNEPKTGPHEEEPSADDMTVVALAMLHPYSRLVEDRKWLKCIIPNAILGEELIWWLLKKVGGIVSRHDAAAYAQQMLNRGLLRSPLYTVTKFKPQWYYIVSPIN